MGARKTVILKKLLFYGICLTGVETTTKRTMSSRMTGIVLFCNKTLKLRRYLP